MDWRSPPGTSPPEPRSPIRHRRPTMRGQCLRAASKFSGPDSYRSLPALATHRPRHPSWRGLGALRTAALVRHETAAEGVTGFSNSFDVSAVLVPVLVTGRGKAGRRAVQHVDTASVPAFTGNAN